MTCPSLAIPITVFVVYDENVEILYVATLELQAVVAVHVAMAPDGGLSAQPDAI